MTIGIAVHGPDAALAALAALDAVERVGRGAIGGFVSLTVLLPDGSVADLATQRGGAAALRDSDSIAGVSAARHAALMSSGPDRPEPLNQFTPAQPGIGLLTGHRLPNMPGPDGIAPNVAALRLLAGHRTPQQAVEAALATCADLDAGLVAMDRQGRIGIGNSASVAARNDIGSACHDDPGTGLRVAVLHNSIFPHRALADLAVAAALDHVQPLDRAEFSMQVLGAEVLDGPPGRCLIVDPGDYRPLHFAAAQPEWRGPAWEGSPVRRGDPVIAGTTPIGRVVTEAYCILRDGRVTGTRGGAFVTWSRDDTT